MKVLLAITLIGLFVLPSMAQEPAAKKGKQERMTATQKLHKEFAALTLTEVQTASLKVATDQFEATMAELTEQGLTKEVMKKRGELMKAAKDEGLKGKESKDKITAGLTEEENVLFGKLTGATTGLNKAVAGLLTDEQKALLPEATQKRLAGSLKGNGQQGKKGKKGKKAEAAAE